MSAGNRGGKVPEASFEQLGAVDDVDENLSDDNWSALGED